jgi:hypothetical protein
MRKGPARDEQGAGMSTAIHRQPEAGRERSMTATCAWCERVRIGPDGPWIPRAEAPEDLATARTHGICPTCRTLLHEGAPPGPRDLELR